MIVIKFKGGLGNQMFQYALYKQFKVLGKTVYGDLSDYKLSNERPYGLNRFGVTIETPPNYLAKETDSAVEILINSKRWNMWIRKNRYFETEAGAYDPKLFMLESAFIIGYWQTERYFKDLKEELLIDFKFPELSKQSDIEYLRLITTTQSVGIHIRRGDYNNTENNKLFGNICTINYYKESIKYFKQKLLSPVFYIFSNDLEWAKDTFRGDEFIFVGGHSEENGYIDMFLMSKCRHNIIANSSFSWWGAYLKSNDNKGDVIAPAKWLNTSSTPDIWPNEWIRLSNY